jgi:hypothetical protein
MVEKIGRSGDLEGADTWLRIIVANVGLTGRRLAATLASCAVDF